MKGKILGGRYLIKRPLGQGAMAVVYEAEDSHLQRSVAVKVMRPEFATNEHLLNRFIIEAQATAKLSHENIVQLFNMGMDGGYYYLVIEHVKGKTLKQHIADLGALTAEESIEIAIQMCDALIHAHDNGILHRDIKPQNILWYDYGKVKVADFGLARFSSQASMHTEPGAIMGSVLYLSPEQLEGKDLFDSSDLYPVGVILYECLIGQPPFTGENGLEVALAHLQKPMPSVLDIRPDLPPELEILIQKATTKDPTERYLSARALKGALLEVRRLLREMEEKKRIITPPPARLKVKRRKRRKVLLPLVLLPILVGSGIWYWQYTAKENETPIQPIIETTTTKPPNSTETETRDPNPSAGSVISEVTQKKEKPQEKSSEKTPTPEKPSILYYVYAGSFQAKANAEQHAREVKSKTGISAKVVKAVVNGKTMYRVETGSFEDEKQADSQVTKLKKADFSAFKTPVQK
ncbi:protein kinase domain-containing protein [Risungbinella massiliensis]|uniref:protein kinase domain-containing protein n=1 Tax=Risungbinella massiliensis TaxID=1329796 RepID=UPI00069C0460|nr:protein kinase [Risungbinella massiliensis]